MESNDYLGCPNDSIIYIIVYIYIFLYSFSVLCFKEDFEKFQLGIAIARKKINWRLPAING